MGTVLAEGEESLETTGVELSDVEQFLSQTVYTAKKIKTKHNRIHPTKLKMLSLLMLLDVLSIEDFWSGISSTE